MGAPNVSSAIRTMSIARTTPAQKPRGFSSRTLLVQMESSDTTAGEESAVSVVTLYSIPRQPAGKTRKPHLTDPSASGPGSPKNLHLQYLAAHRQAVGNHTRHPYTS